MGAIHYADYHDRPRLGQSMALMRPARSLFLSRLDGRRSCHFRQVAILPGRHRGVRHVPSLLLLLSVDAIGGTLQELEAALQDRGVRAWRLARVHSVNWHFPLIQNIKRDPFEQNVSPNDTKSLLYFGGSLAAPSTAFMYDGLA